MKRTWTVIGVRDVPASFKWYQSLFGQPETGPAHDYFGQIVDPDGTVLLCLHRWGAHEHPTLMSPDEATPGNGLLLFFRGIDDFDLALRRARALAARLEEDPHVNPNTRSREFSLRDPDGYYVTISEGSGPGSGREQQPRVGVGVLVMRDGNVLLGQRSGAHGAGTWALPGGHLEYGEDAIACGRRELLEETGLTAGTMTPGPYTTDLFETEGRHYVTLFLIANEVTGDPVVREPARCRQWGWFRWSSLPTPLFPPLESLRKLGYVPS